MVRDERVGGGHAVRVCRTPASLGLCNHFHPRAVDQLGGVVLPALARFDGRPTAEVVEEIRARDGLELSPELLRLLADFEVLVPAPG